MNKLRYCALTSFTIDSNRSDWEFLTNENHIRAYKIPQGENTKDFARMHNCFKDQIDLPYYANSHSRTLYVLVPNLSLSLQIYHWDGRLLKQTDLTPSQYAPAKNFIVLNLLLSAYFGQRDGFVSSVSPSIYVKPNKNRRFASALQIRLRTKGKGDGKINVVVEDRATRFWCISQNEEAMKGIRKEIPYGLISKEDQWVLRQLKKSELTQYTGSIYVKNTSNSFKSRIPFHNIQSLDKYRETRAFHLSNFINNFSLFLKEKGIKVEQNVSPFRSFKSTRKQISSLTFTPQDIQIVDCRINKDKGIEDVFHVPDSLAFEVNPIFIEDPSQIDPNVPFLIVMDFKGEDFEAGGLLESISEDKYKILKERFPQTASQGFNMNSQDAGEFADPDKYLEYPRLSEEDYKRNATIGITQLLLKQMVLAQRTPVAQLPCHKLIEGKVWISRERGTGRNKPGAYFHLFYIENGEMKIEKAAYHYETHEAIKRITGNPNPQKAWENILHQNNPYKSLKTTDPISQDPYLTHPDAAIYSQLDALVFAKTGWYQIKPCSEKVLYDQEEVESRLREREERRSLEDFISKHEDPISQKVNRFLRTRVQESWISYEDLIQKYGKGDDGIRKSIFNSGIDTRFREHLQKNCNLHIPSKKEGNLFGTFKGIWFNDTQRKYFVGKMEGMKPTQDTSFVLREVIGSDKTVDWSELLPLMQVDFVRHKEMTVLPYPFYFLKISQEFVRQDQ